MRPGIMLNNAKKERSRGFKKIAKSTELISFLNIEISGKNKNRGLRANETTGTLGQFLPIVLL